MVQTARNCILAFSVFCSTTIVLVAGNPHAASAAKSADTPSRGDFRTANRRITPSLVLVRAFAEHETSQEPRHWDIIGTGTGVVVSADGLLITNAHVIGIKNAAKTYARIEALVGNRKYLPARIVGVDWERDLALIKAELPAGWGKLVPAKFQKYGTAYVGQTVMKAGFPGAITSASPTIAHGIITNTRTFSEDYSTPYGVTDARVSHGDSGGPLCNLNGEIVGIDAAQTGDAAIGGVAVNGITHYIPVEVLLDVLPKLRQGNVRTGWLGINPSGLWDMRDAAKDDFLKEHAANFLKTQGAVLPNVSRGILILGIADPASGDAKLLHAGDVVLAMNGSAPQDDREFVYWITMVEPGSEIVLDVLRDGMHLRMRLHIGEYDWQKAAAELRMQQLRQPQELPGRKVPEEKKHGQ